MLDENLPAFFWKRSPDGIAHHEAIYMSYQGSDPDLTYTLKHADPKHQAARNCYAAALFDSHNPEVLYGEVLVQPTWTRPTLSQEEIRKNGGVPPPPQAIIPGDFTIQMYEPDQQVQVRRKVGGLSSSTSYEFDMPQTSFRTPSASALDRTQHDPAATLTTPKVNFVWRKESRLSKDYTCFMTGKSTDAITKKKNRDPDIAIALFRSAREITLYEPNLSRVEIEDLKGLELVVILAAATIKDIYLSDNPKEIFNIDDGPARKLSSGGRKVVPMPSQVPVDSARPAQRPFVPTTVNPNAAQAIRPNRAAAQQRPPQVASQYPPTQPTSQQRPPQQQRPTQSQSQPPPPKDARSQWEIDAETSRLRAQVAAEEKEQARISAQRKKDQAKADEAETKRLRKLVETEQKEAKRKQEAVAKETERLRKKYGKDLPTLPVRPASAASAGRTRPQQGGPAPVSSSHLHPRPQQRPASHGYMPSIPQGLRPSGPPQQQQSGGRMYLHPNQSAYVQSGAMMSGAAGPGPSAGPSRPPAQQPGRLSGRKSFLGLRELEDEFRKVSKKRSSIW